MNPESDQQPEQPKVKIITHEDLGIPQETASTPVEPLGTDSAGVPVYPWSLVSHLKKKDLHHGRVLGIAGTIHDELAVMVVYPPCAEHADVLGYPSRFSQLEVIKEN